MDYKFILARGLLPAIFYAVVTIVQLLPLESISFPYQLNSFNDNE